MHIAYVASGRSCATVAPVARFQTGQPRLHNSRLSRVLLESSGYRGLCVEFESELFFSFFFFFFFIDLRRSRQSVRCTDLTSLPGDFLVSLKERASLTATVKSICIEITLRVISIYPTFSLSSDLKFRRLTICFTKFRRLRFTKDRFVIFVGHFVDAEHCILRGFNDFS